MGRDKRTARSAAEEAAQGALAKVMSNPTADVATFMALLGCGKNQAYAVAKAGHFGAFKTGSTYHFPTAVLREVLHLKEQTTAPAQLTCG